MPAILPRRIPDKLPAELSTFRSILTAARESGDSFAVDASGLIPLARE